MFSAKYSDIQNALDTARAKVSVIENELEEMGNLSKILDRQLNITEDKYNVDSILDRVDGILKDQKSAMEDHFESSALDSFNFDKLDLTIQATQKSDSKHEEKSVATSPSLALYDKKDAAVSAQAVNEPVPSLEKPARDISNIRTEIQEQKSFNLAWLDESQLRNVKKAALETKKKPVASVKAPVGRKAPSVVSRGSNQPVRFRGISPRELTS